MDMCRKAERQLMGFMLYAAEQGGVAPKTAYQYARIVTVTTRKITGVDLEQRQFRDMALLHSRLKVLFPHKVRTRLPRVQQDYIRMWQASDSRNQSAKLIKAFTLTQFQAVCRFADLHDVRRDDITFEDGVIVITIKEHKTSHHVGGQVFDTKYITMPYPVDELAHNLSAGLAILIYLNSDPNYEDVPLHDQFLFRTHDGKQLKYKQQLARLRQVLETVGMDPLRYGLHSPRIGGATCALVSSGGNEFIVKQMGFWKGASVRQYARPTTALIAQIQRGMMQSASTTLCNSTTATTEKVAQPSAKQCATQVQRDWGMAETVGQSRTVTCKVTKLQAGDRVKTDSRRFDVSDVDSDGEACPKWSEENGRYTYGAVLCTRSAKKSVNGKTVKVRYDDGDELWQCRDDLIAILSDDE
jgi:integrase